MKGVTLGGTGAGRAILLLAGRGRRLGELTEDRPKCMIQLGGKSILERSLHALARCGVREAVLVVGYRSDVIQGLVSNSFEGIDIEYVVNERYSETNTVFSLWLAREYLDSPVYLVEGDIVFEADLIDEVTRVAAGDAAWAVVPIGPGRDEGILIAVDAAGRVNRVELVRRPEDRDSSLRHKCGGIQLLSQRLAAALIPSLDQAVSENRTSVFADLVLGELVSRYTIHACSADRYAWAEVDDADDLLMAERVFCKSYGMRARMG